MQTVIVNKVIIGAMALFVMLGMNSLWFKSDNIDAKFIIIIMENFMVN